MEIYVPSPQDIQSYTKIINQHGSGYLDDGYMVYTGQRGEGLASFFGNLVKSAIPVLGRAIKAGARISKPHLQKAATQLVTEGSKRLISSLDSKNKKTSKRRRRRL